MKARHITERLQWRPSAAEQPSSIMTSQFLQTKTRSWETVSVSVTCCDMIMGLNTHMNFDF